VKGPVSTLMHRRPTNTFAIPNVLDDDVLQNPKRMTVSARQTNPLQSSGLEEIRAKVKSKHIIEDPVLYGYFEHYDRICCWGAQNHRWHNGLGLPLFVEREPIVVPHNTSLEESRLAVADSNGGDTNPEASTVAATDDHDDTPNVHGRSVTFSQVYACTAGVTSKRLISQHPIPSFDFTKYTYKTRSHDKALWPRPNPKALASKRTLSEMMSTGHVSKLLAQEGILPVVTLLNPTDKKHLTVIHVPIGPMLDTSYQPYVSGTRFKASSIYNQFRMKKGRGFNDAWLPNISMANAMIIRIREKNGLPIDTDIQLGQSPLGEMIRIDQGLARLGFEFYGSGGNPITNGAAPASANSKGATNESGAREGATFETAQTIRNQVNATMEQLCERGTPICVFGAGKVLPDYDPENEQAYYYGVYKVQWCAQEEPLEVSDIKAIHQKYKAHYPDLNANNLRFHFESRKKFRLVPLDHYKPVTGGYHHLEVDQRDNRKPLFEVDQNEKAYDRLLDLDATPFISEKSMFSSWIEERGYLELVESPFLSPTQQETATALVVKVTDEPKTYSLLRRFSVSEGRKQMTTKMARQAKRKQTKIQHWNILLNCAVAAFARQLEIHVDDDFKIGPLIDIQPSTHKGIHKLGNYCRYFGEESILPRTNPTGYMEALGPELQKSPTTHPIRTYDPKVMLLMASNGGGCMRGSRRGLLWMLEDKVRAADLLLQCMLVEIVKVQVLMEWSHTFHGDSASWRLPLVLDLPEFLDFVDAIIQQSNGMSTRGVTQDQYEMSLHFGDRKRFHQFFCYLGSELEPWLTRLTATLSLLGVSATLETTDLFRDVCGRLATFINSDFGIGDSLSLKSPFQCQHILMDYYEVVADFPFGTPKCPTVGFGGEFGAQLLQENSFNVSDLAMVQRVMSDLKEYYTVQSTSDLTLMGLSKTESGSAGSIFEEVVVAINGRPITTCDPEHGSCMQYMILERKPGCTKGLGQTPKMVFTYCQPIPRADFQVDEAEQCIHEFKRRIDLKDWHDSGGNAVLSSTIPVNFPSALEDSNDANEVLGTEDCDKIDGDYIMESTAKEQGETLLQDRGKQDTVN
jgi:hypothetical protein